MNVLAYYNHPTTSLLKKWECSEANPHAESLKAYSERTKEVFLRYKVSPLFDQTYVKG